MVIRSASSERTRLALGDGVSSVRIDGSLFVGAFTLSTGSGTDEVYLDQGFEFGPTTFGGPALIAQGAGDDTMGRAGPDVTQELIALSTFVIHHGPGN